MIKSEHLWVFTKIKSLYTYPLSLAQIHQPKRNEGICYVWIYCYLTFLIILLSWFMYNDFDINLQDMGGVVRLVGVIAVKNVE